MMSENASGAEFQAYLIVFDDDAPPKQCEVSAMSDEHAVERLRNQYPGFRWKVYRSGSGEAIYAHRPDKRKTMQ
ncbi:MAG TPA: hypothetical protein VF669_16510 [Tepidisphaeraceae bacterium]|jgi:hypothetical protein